MTRSSNAPAPSERPLHVTILGGTGKTGRHVVDQALQAGHHVTVLARTPSKLDVTHERLRVVKGDVQDPAAVSEAIAGSSAVLSVLGPTQNTPDYQVSRGTVHVLEAMKSHGVKRLVISAGAGVGGDGDQPKLFNHVISFVLKLAARHVLEDMTRTVAAVRSSSLDWTVVRVPMLTDGPATGTVRVGRVGVNTGARITRADMARFMLEQLHDASHVRASPVISN
ncbi:MAG: SDR family oxidoreductase [Trueperaceae bacterium]|nr:MAG: SDR family oxidoreductase [Trueperaceae bacterium]